MESEAAARHEPVERDALKETLQKTQPLRKPVARLITRNLSAGNLSTHERPRTTTHAQTGVWGRSGRFPESRVVTPGPNHYAIPMRVNGRAQGEHRPGFSMRQRTLGGIGTGFTRKKPENHDYHTPGPGSYEPTPATKLGKTFSPLYPSKSETSPGPADYGNIYEGIGRTGLHFTMRARTKTAWAGDMSLDWKSNRRPATTTHAKEQGQKRMVTSRSEPVIRTKPGLVADASTPGPAEYNPSKPFGNYGPKKTLSYRFQSSEPSYPGPGQYNNGELFAIGKEGPKYGLHDRTKNKLGGSFIEGDTSKHRPPVHGPGPGRYNHTSTFHIPSFNAKTPVSQSAVMMHTAAAAEFDKSEHPLKPAVVTH